MKFLFCLKENFKRDTPITMDPKFTDFISLSSVVGWSSVAGLPLCLCVCFFQFPWIKVHGRCSFFSFHICEGLFVRMFCLLKDEVEGFLGKYFVFFERYFAIGRDMWWKGENFVKEFLKDFSYRIFFPLDICGWCDNDTLVWLMKIWEEFHGLFSIIGYCWLNWNNIRSASELSPGIFFNMGVDWNNLSIGWNQPAKISGFVAKLFFSLGVDRKLN